MIYWNIYIYFGYIWNMNLYVKKEQVRLNSLGKMTSVSKLCQSIGRIDNYIIIFFIIMQ